MVVDAQRKARVLRDYEELHGLADNLANWAEQRWLGSWPDSTWQMDSVRAVDALNDACIHLQQIIGQIRATPTDS